MNKLRRGLPLFFSCVLGCVGSGNLQAAATSYQLTDLGPYLGRDPRLDAAGHLNLDGTGGNPSRTGANAYENAIITHDGGLNYEAKYSVAGGPLIPIIPPHSNQQTYIHDMNSHGVAVGVYVDANFPSFNTIFPPAGEVFKISPDGSVAPVPTLDGTFGAAIGINDAGVIVGRSPTSTFYHAFLYDGKVAVDLNDLIAPVPGLTLDRATGIDDVGRIAVVGYGKDGIQRDYLLTPLATPEPGAWAVALAASGYLGLRGLARRGGE